MPIKEEPSSWPGGILKKRWDSCREKLFERRRILWLIDSTNKWRYSEKDSFEMREMLIIELWSFHYLISMVLVVWECDVAFSSCSGMWTSKQQKKNVEERVGLFSNSLKKKRSLQAKYRRKVAKKTKGGWLPPLPL